MMNIKRETAAIRVGLHVLVGSYLYLPCLAREQGVKAAIEAIPHIPRMALGFYFLRKLMG